MRVRYFFKIVQRRTYDILSNRGTLFCFLAFFVVLPITILVILEKVLWIWNSHQSLVLFNSDYGGLMVDKSGSLTLCENKPSIDVVYTWVNGSERAFLRKLMKAKRDYLQAYGDGINCSLPLECGDDANDEKENQEKNNHLRPPNNGSSGKTGFAFMDTSLIAIEVSLEKEISSLGMFRNPDPHRPKGDQQRFEVITTELTGNQYNLLHLTSDRRNLLINYLKLHNRVEAVKPIYISLTCSNFSELSQRRNDLVESFVYPNLIFLSSTSRLPKETLISESILSSSQVSSVLSFSPSSSSSSASSSPSLSSSTFQWLPPRKQFLRLLNDRERSEIRNIIFHSSRRAAVIVLEPFMVHDRLIEHFKTLGQRYNFTISSSVRLYLGDQDLVQCGSEEEKLSEPLTVNRFADNDELKYSLRSIEKFAPWIRNIYLVTNGQIPNWLNVEHPKIHLVTHEDIFPNKDDLPTFNSVAIECHLHRIPGLSDKFLYFNDDIMLGKPVFLEDFYSSTNGYMIYLAWPVPNCESGCPTSWLGDGFCDLACNTTICLFDGGDCLNKTSTSPEDRPVFPIYKGGPGNLGSYRPLTDQCKPSCADFWLGDKYCDSVCNNPDCAFDMGDCGVDGYSTMPGALFRSDEKVYYYPSPIASVYLNLTEFMSQPGFSLNRASYSKDTRIRSMTISLRYRVLTVLFTLNVTEMTVPIELSFSSDKGKTEMKFTLNISSITPKPEIDEMKTNSPPKSAIPVIPVTVKSDNLDSSALDKSTLPDNVTSQSEPIIIFELNLKDDLDLSSIVDPMSTNSTFDYPDHRQLNGQLKQALDSLVLGKYEGRPIGMYPWETEETFKQLAEWISAREKYLTSLKKNLSTGPNQRRLLDLFSDSIKHVNYLYNRVFGIKARRIIAHSPLLLDKKIINRLWETFPDQLSATSSHKFRSSDDMQFSFTYFNFLMSETSPTNLAQVIQSFDTDDSSGLSANELRSLIANVAHPRLVKDAWFNYSACWNHSEYEELKRVGYELSIDQLMDCEPIVRRLETKFSSLGKNLFTQLTDGEVAFTMIRPNYNHLINKLDSLRREPKKFLCFNDDLHGDEDDERRNNETDRVRAALQDYYEYLVPKRSSFELLAENGEKVHWKDIDSYRVWKHSRKLINSVDPRSSTTWFYLTLYGLILFWIIYKLLIVISKRSMITGKMETLKI